MTGPIVQTWCKGCDAFHGAEVLEWDADKFPTKARWVTAHQPSSEKQEHLEAIGELGGRNLAMVVDAGQWHRVEEVLEQVLSMNDPPREGEEPS
jgi:hypothetical protein